MVKKKKSKKPAKKAKKKVKVINEKDIPTLKLKKEYDIGLDFTKFEEKNLQIVYELLHERLGEEVESRSCFVLDLPLFNRDKVVSEKDFSSKYLKDLEKPLKTIFEDIKVKFLNELNNNELLLTSILSDSEIIETVDSPWQDINNLLFIVFL